MSGHATERRSGFEVARGAQKNGRKAFSLGLFETFLLAARRDLVTLGLQAMMTTGAVLVLEAWKPLPVEAPGEMFNTVLLLLVAIAWLASLSTDRRS